MKSLLFLCCILLATAAQAADGGYHVVKTLRIGGDGGWDYSAVDAAARRLYVSRGTHVTVLDLDTGRIAGDLPDTPGVHGIAVAPGLNRGFTSNGRANSSTVFDLKSLKKIGEIKTGAGPDAIVYEPVTGQVFTFNGRSHDATVFGAESGEVAGTIPLGGKPEFAAVDGMGAVFVNIEDTDEVVEIDAASRRIVRRISIKPCDEPAGMAIDPRQGRVFSGCHNRMMTVLDVGRQKVVATVPIGAHVDANGFDPETGLIFSSNGDGTLTVVREASPGKFEVAETVPTRRGCRTMAIDPKTHTLYLPAARFNPPPAGSRNRPAMIPGSFEILVVGR
ncbi:hypothetical protein GMSM_46320 [Geomonas sp. Red276]